MSFNTDTFKQPKAKRAALYGHRVLSWTAIAWMLATFAQKDDVDRLREWQKSNSQRISQLQSNLLVLELTTVKVKAYERNEHPTVNP